MSNQVRLLGNMDNGEILLSEILKEPVTNRRAAWVLSSVLSLSIFLIFLTSDSIPGIVVTLGITVFAGRKSGLYKDKEGGKL